jgi:uncharacterized metal-binding protein YceD (DUF177 family)
MTAPVRPEWSRPERIDTIGTGERPVTIEADADERRRLAGRFGLVAVERLAASFRVRREGEAIVATGRVEASVIQACSVTGEPLPARVDEAVTLRFVDDGAASAGDAEVELAADALDTMPIEGDAIDLGEAAAETMALALDPFPRAPGAAAALAAAGVVNEEAAKPLGGLAALKDMLKRD